MNEALVDIKGLKKYYPIRRGFFTKEPLLVKAVDGVNLTIRRGETLGLVGESGCGKSTLGRLILRLEEPDEGTVYFEGRNILEIGANQLRRLRREIQIIFQDPYSSLNPRKNVDSIIGQPLAIHGLAGGK